MLCDNCKQRPATVHLTKIINNEKYELHLCQECANEQKEAFGFGFSVPFSLGSFLSNVFDTGYGVRPSAEEKLQCGKCGMRYDDFRKIGKLGCDNCYNVFSERLIPVISRLHKTTEHRGKVPRQLGSTVKAKKDIEVLKEKLKKAIEKEEYEEAAVLRDRIRELENKEGKGGNID